MKIKCVVIAGLLLLSAAVLAHQGATGIVKERMDSMEVMGDSAKQTAAMFKGKSPYDAAVVLEALRVFAEQGELIDGYFPNTPASRNGKATRALPALWQQQE